jgi:putative membrane protein
VVAEGLIFRKHRSIPYARIQNINTRQNPVHRLLAVATVQLESASGGKPEAVLRVIDLATVARLREKVQAAQAHSAVNRTGDTHGPARQATESAPEKAEKPATNSSESESHPAVLLQMPLADVVRYGLVSQKGLVVFALLSGFFSQSPRWYQNIGASLAGMGWLPDWSAWSTTRQTITAVALVLLVVLLLQLFSIGWAVFRFYGFRLLKKPGRLFAEMGWLSRTTATIPEERIQLYRIRRNPIHRWLGGVTVTVETAGGVNTEQQGLVMRWLAPYMPVAQVPAFLARVDAASDWHTNNWQALPWRAWRRLFKRLALIWAMMVAVATTVLTFNHQDIPVWLVLLALLVPLPFFAGYARAWVKAAGWSLNETGISFKSGVLLQQQTHVKMDKVQVVDTAQSPFDRRHRMATLEVDTAGANALAHHIKIPYLPQAEAVRIRQFILQRLKKPVVSATKARRSALQSGA